MQFPVTDTVDVYRLTRTANKDAYAATPAINGLSCGIYPAGPDILAVYGGQPSLSLHEIYIDQEAALQNGDKLVSGGKAYVIRGVPEVYTSPFVNYQRVIGEKVL